MLIYLIIGICLLTYSNISQAKENFEKWKKDILEYPGCWCVATILCILLWPILILWALYDAIKMVQEEEL